MRDGAVILLSLVLSYPHRPLKYYVEMSGMSRATFFKVKKKLESRNVIKCTRTPSGIQIKRENALSYLEVAYPGMTKLFTEDDQNLVSSEVNPES